MLEQLRLSASKINILDLLDECIIETKEELFLLVRSQIESGQTSEDYLPVYSSDRYAVKKQQMGSKAPFGITDLKLTGNFLNKFVLRFSKYSFVVRSSDKKNKILLQRYGEEIFMLNEENMDKYVNEILQPLMVTKLKDVLLK